MPTQDTSSLGLRSRLSEEMIRVLQSTSYQSEVQVAQRVKTAVAAIPEVLPEGWYSPPPAGIGVLFGDIEDHYARTHFDSLRNMQYWPKDEYVLETETVGIVYASPVRQHTGVIGDWGATIYRGTNLAIQNHLVKCLRAVEQLAEYAEVGMEFGDISRYADKLLEEQHLVSDRTVLTTKTSGTGINCGHTLPWTDHPPTPTELKILESDDQKAINALISSKRIFINANEAIRIPETITFTSELRLESLDDPQLPNGYFHILVRFLDGQKTIAANFNPFFDAVGMNYIQSMY